MIERAEENTTRRFAFASGLRPLLATQTACVFLPTFGLASPNLTFDYFNSYQERRDKRELEQEQIDLYNKQKGKTRAKKLMPTSPVEAYIDSRLKARELAEQEKVKETIDKQVKEEIEKQLKDIFK